MVGLKPRPMKFSPFKALLAVLSFAFCTASADASIAYGSLNNFDTVNDTGVECHGFEIEIEDCHSTSITYTYDYNHYGVSKITEDNSVPGHPRCIIRWESKKKPDGTWAAYTAIPAGPITPTNGHMFTNPSVNFGGEHFGVGYNAAVGPIHYHWLIDDGAGALVQGPAVQVATPEFTYYPPLVVGEVGQVQAAIEPPEKPEAPEIEFGPAVWVKEIRTTTHNNRKVKLRDLVSDDPADANDKNWRNGEPDEIEVEWDLLQAEFGVANGGKNGKKLAAAEDLPAGDEVVTRRYEFFKYVGPIDVATGEALADTVGADDLHGVVNQKVNGVDVDYSGEVIVGEYAGAQMAAVDVEGALGLVDHVSEGEVNQPYTPRTVVIMTDIPATITRTGDLPAGMTFDVATGILAGTPTVAGEFLFKITATDGVHPDVEKKYTLRIAEEGGELPAVSLLDTSAFPVGTGTTTGDGAFPSGSNVTVNATANPGFRFVNWTDNGKIVSNNASYTFGIDVNHSLVANFTLDVPQWFITTDAAPAAGGSTSGGGLKDEGSSATVIATANVGYAFTNWTQGGAVVSTNASYTFTVTAARTLFANFTALPSYTVATSAAPVAGGTTTGAGAYFSGASATVTAAPNAGYVFTKWTVAGATVSTLPSYTFSVTANKTLVANFIVAGTPQTIAISASPTAAGTVSGGGTYPSGNDATVIATTNPGYVFLRWQEGSATVSTSPSYTFMVTGNRTLVAKYDEAFVISTSSSPAAGGTTEMDSATYKTGERARAKAFPATGYTFANWTANGAVVSTSTDYRFDVTGNRTLVANFTLITTANISANSSPVAGGTTTGQGVYQIGSIATVSARENAGYKFMNWTASGEIVSYTAEYAFVATSNRTLTANYLAIPQLTATPNGNQIVISWPAADADWILQESTDLVTWVDSVRPATTTGAQKSVSASAGGAGGFFRLVHP